MTDAKKKQLIRLFGSEELEDALVFENRAALKPVSKPWTSTEFGQILPLWKKLFSRGTNETAETGWERFISQKGTSNFLEKVSVVELKILTKPRDANGHPYFDVENFPLFFEVADIQKNVPLSLPNSVTFSESDESQSNPVPVKWADWKAGSKTVKSIGGKNVVGAFNVQDGKSFAHYLRIEESTGSGFKLLSKKEYDALVPSPSAP